MIKFCTTLLVFCVIFALGLAVWVTAQVHEAIRGDFALGYIAFEFAALACICFLTSWAIRRIHK